MKKKKQKKERKKELTSQHFMVTILVRLKYWRNFIHLRSNGVTNKLITRSLSVETFKERLGIILRSNVKLSRVGEEM